MFLLESTIFKPYKVFYRAKAFLRALKICCNACCLMHQHVTETD